MDFSLITIIAEGNGLGYWLQLSTWWSIIQVVLGLGFVIFVHELGHFLVAKACGVKCEKFYVGFDVPIKLFGRQILPAALFRKQIGETEYGVGMIPLGGYVKMLGQDDNPNNISQEIERSKGETDSDGEVEKAGYVDRNELDPRSFRAKSVPQRMAIISAGVIFNLIFAVLFAALAFRSGVNYDPASVGAVMGGGPAWEQNLAGAKLFRVNDEIVSEDRYFTWADMTQEIVFSADEGPVEFDLIRAGTSEREVVETIPRKGVRKEMPDLPLLGFGPDLIAEVGSDDMIYGHAAVNATPALKKGDRVIGVDGIKIDDVATLRRTFYLKALDPVELLVARENEDGTEEEIKVAIGPNPAREIGFGFQWGSVEAIQVGSPAVAAGFQKGDKIVAVKGFENRGPVTFDSVVSRHLSEGGGAIEFTVERGGATKVIPVTPVPSMSMSTVGPEGLWAIDSIGIAVTVPNQIANIAADSKLIDAGVKEGAEVLSVKFLLSEEAQEESIRAPLHEKEFEIRDTCPAEIVDLVDKLPAGTEFEFVFKIGESEKAVTVASSESEDRFLATRGFELSSRKSYYQSETWSDAFSNGCSQVKNDAGRVWAFLTKLVTGKLSVTNMGGPAMIAVAATSEASQGTSRLLLFLTLLSANLAIVNFLPIPVLDGGHMMFLTYEGLFRRPVSEKVEILLTWGGLFFILGLMIFVSTMDFWRLTS